MGRYGNTHRMSSVEDEAGNFIIFHFGKQTQKEQEG